MNITDIDDKIIIRSNEQNVNFAEFAKMWEEDFFKDMSYLNVAYPTYITRVSEYVSEIKDSIRTIINHNYAYASNGSVYFSIDNFTKDKHDYKKLTPGTGTKEEADEGEGKLSAGTDKDKKNPGDFALWKKSKEKEPFWESEWGNGRPGWHIECSAMCKEVFGDKLDIHSGGIDLKFPHHDNEIAQTEAIYNSKQVILILINQWVNYFLHTGHLHIDKMKMGKKEKNFIKIKDVIKEYNHNSIRLYFVTHSWHEVMEFTMTGLNEAKNIEKYIAEFFRNLKIWLKENDLKRNLKFDEIDLVHLTLIFQNLKKSLEEKRKIVHDSLCSNINTKVAFTAIHDLISFTYTYAEKVNRKTLKLNLVYDIGQFISFILRTFGLVYKTEFLDSFVTEK